LTNRESLGKVLLLLFCEEISILHRFISEMLINVHFC
jgi:hypothetical protein